jgi:hypothetical protein
MTVANLVVEIEARNRSLKSVLADSTRGVNTFAREIEKANKTVAALQWDLGGNRTGQMGGASSAQLARVRELTKGIIENYKQQAGELRKLFKAGDIKPEEYAARGAALAEATVKGAKSTIEANRGLIGDQVTNTLLGSVDKAMTRATQATERGARNIKAVQRVLNEVDADRDRALTKLDQAIGEGRVSAAERTLKRAEIIAQRNEALIRRINEMEAKGQMRPALREAALSQLDPKGFGVGASRTEFEKNLQDAERQIRRMRDRMETEVARTKLDLAAGLDPKIGEKRIIAAYENMNRGIEHGRRRMEAARTLTPEVERLLSGSLVNVPKARLNLTPIEQNFQDAKQTIRKLQNDLQTELARTKLDMAAGPSGVIASAVQQASQAAPTGRLIDRLFPDRQEAARRGGEVGRSFASNTLASLKLVGERIKEAVFPGRFFEKSFAGVQRRAEALRERMAQPSLSAISPELTTRELTLERIRSRAQERARERSAAREDANRSVADAVQTGNRIGQALGKGMEAGQQAVVQTLGQRLQAERQRIETSFEAFRRGLDSKRASLRATNMLTPEVEREMDKALTAAERAVQRSRTRIMDAQTRLARDGVTKFRDAYNASIRLAKLQTTTGEIDVKGFTTAANKAKLAFNKELDALRRDLDARGLLTPEAARLIDRQFQKAGKEAASSFTKALAQASADPMVQTLNKLGNAASQVGRSLTFGLTAPLVGVGTAAVKLAADAEQAQKRLEQMFGPLSVDLMQELKQLQKEVPATTGELFQMAARFGELLIPLGLAPDMIARMSKELIIASKNIGVFAGVNSERSMNAIINALIGQSRELKKLGIEIDDITIRDEVYRLGIARVGSTLSTTQKVLGAYNVILQRSQVVSSTLQDQQNTFNVRLIFFQKTLKETGIVIGNQLLPFMTQLVQRAGELVTAFRNMSESTRGWVLTLAGIAVVLGPALIMLGSFLRTLAAIRTAYLTLQLVSLASGATAASGGAFMALLGVSAGTLATLGLFIGLIATLAEGLDRLKTTLGDFRGLSNEYVRGVQEMTRSELEHALTVARLDEMLAKRKRDEFAQQHGIKELPGGLVIGGDVLGKERREFIRMGEQIKEVQARVTLIDKTWKDLEATQNRINKGAEDWQKRLDEIAKSSNDKLLIESLRGVRAEYGRIMAAARNATSAIRTGIRTADPDLLAEGLQKSEETLTRVTGLLERVKEMQADPEFAPLGKDLDKLTDDLGTLQNRLQGVIQTAGRSSEIAGFARDVRVAIAELTNDQAAGRDITQSLERVNELAEETGKRMRAIKVDDKTMDMLRLLAVQLETAARNAAKVDIGGLTSRVSLELEALRDATERAKDATGTERSQAMEVLFTQLVRVAQVEREINDMIALNVGTAKQRNQLQERLIELKRAERAANQEVLQSVDIFLPGLREELTRQADRLKGAQAVLEVAIRIPDNDQAIRQAKQAISRIQQEVGETLKESLSGGMFDLLDKAGKADVLRQVDAMMKELGIDGRTFNDELERTDAILDRISIGIRGIGEIFEALGVEAKEARELVRGLNLAVDSIKQVRATLRARRERSTEDPFDLSKPFDPGFNVSEMVALFSGIAGTIGSVVSIIGAVQSIISSQSRMQQEHNEIIRKNNENLEEMTSQLRGFTLSVGNQLRVQRAVVDPRVQDAIRGAAPRQALEAIGTLPLGSTMEAINKELGRFGLTFADINRVAKENGITLLDKKGRVVAGAFDQLAKAIGINVELLTTYGDTLADQTAALDLRSDVFDVEQTPQQIIKDQVGLLAKLAPELFAQFFAGVDLSDIAAVEAANRRLTEALLSGALDLSAFGGLLDKDELVRIITGVERGLDGLSEGLDKATESILNVPTWFRTNQVRFESVDPFIPEIPKAPEGPPTPLPPGVGNPPLGPGGVNVGTQNVTINITQQPGEDAEDLAEQVVARLRADKFIRTGTTRLPGIDD